MSADPRRVASPSGTGGIRLERLNRCYECEVAFPEPVPVEQAMDDFGDYLDGVGYLCSACADEFDGPAERGPSGTGHDTATDGDPIALLLECLNDPEPWDADALVARLEAVFVALGGIIEEGEAHV